MKLFYLDKTEQFPNKEIFAIILDRLPEVAPDLTQSEVELLLTDDKEIKSLNKKYRKKDKATDVLSFPLEDENLLGQIVISVDQAKTQAKDLGQSLEDELRFLFTHAVLHLIGFDHQDPEDEKIMLKMTYKLLRRENN